MWKTIRLSIRFAKCNNCFCCSALGSGCVYPGVRWAWRWSLTASCHHSSSLLGAIAMAWPSCLSRCRHLSRITVEMVPGLSKWYFVSLSILAASYRFLIELLGRARGQMTQLTFCSLLSYLASHSRKEESELLIKGKWVAVTTMQRIRIVAPAILLKLQLLTTVDNCWQILPILRNFW